MGKHQRTKPMKPFMCGFCKGRFFSLASTEDHVRTQHPRRAQVDVFERVSSVVNERPPEDDESVADMMIRLSNQRAGGGKLDEIETRFADMAEGRI